MRRECTEKDRTTMTAACVHYLRYRHFCKPENHKQLAQKVYFHINCDIIYCQFLFLDKFLVKIFFPLYMKSSFVHKNAKTAKKQHKSVYIC